jgi:blue copper oxidase
MTRARTPRALALVALLAAPACASGPNAPDRADFSTPLPVPTLLEGEDDGEGGRRFHLRAMQGEREFLPGVRTPTLGVNGGHLGPTLIARRGERVAIRLDNELDEVTTMHWHGMELPARMDGGPHQPVMPGERWEPTWEIRQPAATLWYHPHPHGATESQVYRGMAGFFLIEDDHPAGAALPSEYGVDDIPVLVQDIELDREGRLVRRKPFYNQVGPLGSIVLANGVVTPHLEVGRERVRLRLLNGSVARVYNFGFADGRPFAVVAGDGGLLAAPVHLERLQLSPGERAEIVVELAPGARSVLMSYPQELGTDPVNHRLSGGNDTFAVLELRAADVLEPSHPLPSRLMDTTPPDARDATRVRSFRVSSTTINGLAMDMSRIDAEVAGGSTEIWEVEGIAVPHNFHVHGVQFHVLDVDGEAVAPAFRGRKDTVYLVPDVVTRLLVRFPESDGDGAPFMFHCHLLRHEDDGAMGQFLVVPG